VLAAPDTPLLYVLRNELKLMGTRFGCGLGQCGACNVLVDGRKVASCDIQLWATEGKHITTLEGLGTLAQMDVLQQAFVDEHAAQCGYCVSGIIISAKALLSQNPDPSEAQIRAALDDNLCRCGTHNRFVRAIQLAAKRMANRETEGAPQ
jgi:nicotinate dehydrogenase subunit A